MVRFHRPGRGGDFTAEQIVKALNDIDGINDAHIAETGEDYVIEWQMHDPAARFTSAMTINRDSGELLGLAIRMGPVGEWDEVSFSEESNLEGEWWDMVFTAEDRAGIDNFVGKSGVDLGHEYISDYMRPHVRKRRKTEGYNVSIQDVIDFIEALNEVHKERWGTLEGRMTDPEMADNFSG